jgi:hypothetical protein
MPDQPFERRPVGFDCGVEPVGEFVGDDGFQVVLQADGVEASSGDRDPKTT